MRPGGEACDESGNCQIHFAVIICLPFLVLVRYTMSCAGVFLILSQLVILVILNLFNLSLSMPCFVRDHDRLSVAIMHCVTRDMGSRSKMNLSLVLNPRVAVMRL